VTSRRAGADGAKPRRNGMPTGTVKWFNTTKGYGFIAPDDGGKDIFVHISAVERAGLTGLADNQKVSFELIEGRDGRQSAGDLKPL
jgi:cold shock protein